MKSLLISKCLLGENVRYDGGNCLISTSHIKMLERKFKLFPVCPELMAQMGVPRDPIEIFEGKLINKEKDDFTDLFIPVKNELSDLIKRKNIQFALLKEFSPSCGVRHIHNGLFDGGIIAGHGLIAKHLLSLGVKAFSEKEISKLFDAI